MTSRSLLPTEYFPTSPRSGNAGAKVFRMQNMILRGEAGEPYAEVYGGSRNLNEDIATATITGTVACTINVATVVGTSTLFKTELHLGQRLEVYGGTPSITIPLVVDEIIDDTHFTACRPPYASTTGASCVRLPRMFEMGKRRGTALWGNGVEFDQGTIIGLGDGTLRRNGAVLPGTSMTLARTPKIAIFNPSTGNFSVYPLGMTTPATLSAVAQAGGVKNMQAGLYSTRVVPGRKATNGYNNPSPKAEVTLVAGDMSRDTLPAADTTNGQDIWIFFGDLYTQAGAINGPWYQVKKVNIGSGSGEIPAAGGTYDLEWNDAEISSNDLLSFDNDAPSAAEFIAVVDGRPVYISCNGPGETSPGPRIAPSKTINIEAAPARWYVSTSLPDTIVGFAISEGRLYLMCVNSLQIAVATQTQDPRIPPLVVRPFWKAGFKNPDTLLPLSPYLIGMTSNGLARSPMEGKEGSEQFGFAIAIQELIATISPGHCLLKLDPKNNAACLFVSGYNLNSSGYWTTRVFMYSLREDRWIGDILLTSTTGDMIVSGAEAINGELEFLAGGRQAGGTTVVRTYRWDDPLAATAVPYYISWQFSDWGLEDRCKVVKQAIVNAKQGAGGTLGIHGAGPGESIPVTALETNNSGSKSGALTLPVSTTSTQGTIIEMDVDELKQFTARVDGTWSGSGDRDRIDEVVLFAEQRGARR